MKPDVNNFAWTTDDGAYIFVLNCTLDSSRGDAMNCGMTVIGSFSVQFRISEIYEVSSKTKLPNNGRVKDRIRTEVRSKLQASGGESKLAQRMLCQAISKRFTSPDYNFYFMSDRMNQRGNNGIGTGDVMNFLGNNPEFGHFVASALAHNHNYKDHVLQAGIWIPWSRESRVFTNATAKAVGKEISNFTRKGWKAAVKKDGSIDTAALKTVMSDAKKVKFDDSGEEAAIPKWGYPADYKAPKKSDKDKQLQELIAYLDAA